MCIDLRIDTCIHMRIETCMYSLVMCTCTRAQKHTDMCVEMHIDTCASACARHNWAKPQAESAVFVSVKDYGACVTHICTDMRIDMCLDMCLDMCVVNL